MRKTIVLLSVWLWFVLTPGNSVLAAGISGVEIVGNQVLISINVNGLYQAQMTLTFESVLGLNQNTFDINAELIDPLDATLLSRLPSPTDISVPGLFPISISVSPTSESGLTATGLINVELSTSNLVFNPALRLFKAPDGGSFHDVTDFSGVGSYRVRGSTSDFSEFLIVADIRDPEVVADQKFSRLQTFLTAHADLIDADVHEDLQNQLTTAHTHYLQGRNNAAAGQLQAFTNTVKQNEGAQIPNIYRANDPSTINVSGGLRCRAATLIFSLRLF